MTILLSPHSLALLLGHQEIDQLFQERDQIIAKLGEMSRSGDNDVDPSGYDKRSSSMNSTQATNSQDDEGEEGEISESD